MPLYDFLCGSCDLILERPVPFDDRHKQTCPICEEPIKMLMPTPAVHVFQETVFDHIGPEPIVIKDKKHLKRECEIHKCYAPSYIDGVIDVKEI